MASQPAPLLSPRLSSRPADPRPGYRAPASGSWRFLRAYATTFQVIDGIRYLSLPRLVELKLASGMTGGIHRMKDFTDVVQLIESRGLSDDFASDLGHDFAVTVVIATP